MFFIFPIQRPHGYYSSLLIDVESIVLVPIHDGKGERWAVVGSVPISYGELENTCAFWSIFLWDTREAEFVFAARGGGSPDALQFSEC